MIKSSLNLSKNGTPPFEIKEEYLAQIEIPNLTKEAVCFVDESQTGYDDPRWIEKSNSIKARDNYTCQLCHAFNPMLGDFVFMKQSTIIIGLAIISTRYKFKVIFLLSLLISGQASI